MTKIKYHTYFSCYKQNVENEVNGDFAYNFESKYDFQILILPSFLVLKRTYYL